MHNPESFIALYPRSEEFAFQEGARQMKENLLIAYDALYGITSQFEDQLQIQEDQINCRTYIRDATKQSQDDTFTPPDPESPAILGINFKLRTMMLMRAIHFTIAYKISEIDHRIKSVREDSIKPALTHIKDIYSSQLDVLVGAYNAAIADNNLRSKTSMDKAEKIFNTQLAAILHICNLDEGIKDKKDFEKLLFRYRTYSSVLDPALAMETIFKVTSSDDVEHFFKETALPIREKTDEQKIAFNNGISGVDLAAIKKTFHTICSAAEQEINCAFRDLITQDDRMLGPQGRKFIPFSVKNAYVVYFFKVEQQEVQEYSGDREIFSTEPQYEYKIKNHEAFDNLCYVYVRHGMPVYVGPGEQNKCLEKYVSQNILQLREFFTCIPLPQLSEQTKSAIRNKKPRSTGSFGHVEMDELIVNQNQFLKEEASAAEESEEAVEDDEERGGPVGYSPHLNFYVLVTDVGQFLSRLINDNGEHKMSQVLKSISEISITQVPINLPGRFFKMDFMGSHANHADELPPDAARRNITLPRMDTVTRLIMQNAAGEALQIICCASARDRTGIVCEQLVAEIAKVWLQKKSNFQQQHIRALHNVMLGNLNTPPGHFGLDPGSRQVEYFSLHSAGFLWRKSYFDPTNDALLFRKVSLQLKKAPLKNMPPQFYVASEITKEEYQIARNNLCGIIRGKPQKIKNAVYTLLQVIDTQFARNNHDDINLLTAVLKTAVLIVSDNSPENLIRFENLRKKIKGHIHPKPMALGTLLFAIGVMLCVTGIHGIYFSEKDMSMISPLGLSLIIFLLGTSLSACGGSYACFWGCAEGYFSMPKVLKEMANFSQAVTSSADHNPYVIEVGESSPLLFLH